MKIRVLQVGKFFPPDSGGIETTTKDLTEVTGENYVSDVLCFSASRKTQIEQVGKAKIIRSGTLFTIASMPFSLSYFYYFKKIRNAYNIIHLHHPNPLGTLCLLLFKYKAKFVLHWHSDILNKGLFYKIFYPIERAVLKKADKIVTTSPIYIDHSPALKDFKHKCTFIPSAYNEESLQVDESIIKSIKERYGNKKIVFSLGRHVSYKGFHFLIQAAQYLPEDVVVVIGGSGPLYNTHAALVKQLKLEEKVFLPGKIPGGSLGSYYAACDVFCLPSCHKAEGFGLVIIEAMRFGKPVVAAKIPGSGVSWVNADGVTGINAENENPASLAAAVTKVLSDKALYNQFSQNAYTRYKRMFTDIQMRTSFSQLYAALLRE